MATASEDSSLLTRSSSYELLPPDMSELRVVLLGNSWSHRCSVGNLLLNKTVFSSREEPFIVLSEPLIDKKLTVINTPDLLRSDITEGQLTEYIQQLAHASAPGPHVFLLVLQPQAFTQTHQQRTQSVLSKFSEHPFDHSLVVVSTDQEESPETVCMNNQPLEKIVQKCRYRYLWLKSFGEEEIKLRNFKVSEILSRLGQIVRENNGSHLNYEVYEDSVASAPSALPDTTQKGTVLGLKARVQREGFTAVDPREQQVSQSSPILTNHLRMLLFGKNDDQKKISKLITGTSSWSNQKVEHGQWRGKQLTVVRTKDLLTKSVKEVREDIQTCVGHCSPGPNVLLLLVRPSDFTEETRGILKFFLTMLGPNALKHSIVVFTNNEKPTASARKLIADCDNRLYQTFDQNLSTLMEQVEKMVSNNNTPYVTFTEAFSKEELKNCLNLVLCGRKCSGKTTVADAILGSSSSESSLPECLKRQREVCGRWLSVVEMPALSEKPAKDAMERCFDCISHCEEGVHAFVLVLKIDPLTDEDKAEFKTIQTILNPQVNDFTMVVFTVESDPGATIYTNFVKENKDIQELCQNCGGRYFIFNIRNKLQVPKLLDKVESLTKNRNVPQSYTQRAFIYSQIEKLTAQSHLTAPGTILQSESKRSEESLRIVLIGKTGSGKSASGNTILGLEKFKHAIAQTSVTKLCQKEVSKVDGRRVEVVDTPGLFDSTLNHQEINEEIIKCISLLAPGPHVFLLVLQIGSRFTPEDKDTLNLIKEGFGKGAEKFTIVLFTRGDGLMDMSFEEYIDTCLDDSCKKLISDCGNRCHVFNNNEKDHERPKAQVTELIHKIDAMVEANGGGCYTNEMLQEAEAAIQKEMKRLLKEKEDEFMREKQEIEEKHEKDMQNIKMRLEKQREENEKERQERDKELKELQAKITQERELRKAEQDTREEKDRERQKKDETERQEWEKKLKIVTKESRETLVCEREAWEEKTRQWWENRHKEDEQRRNEEYVRLEKLEKEYNDKIQTFKTKKEEEDRKRREQEERERRELEERHQIKVEELKKMYEEQARKTAEEVNEFQQRKEIDFAAQIQKHLDQISSLKEEIEQEQTKYKLSSHKERTLRSEIQDLRNQHKREMIDLVTAVLLKQKDNNNKIREVQNRHKQELEKCKKEIVEKFKQMKRGEIETLKLKQQQEMYELKKNTKKDDLGVKTQELSARHTDEETQLKTKIWSEQKQELEKDTSALKIQHKEELTKLTKDLLTEHEKHQEKQISELKTKQKQEMEQFMKTDGTEKSPEEEQQQAKHEEEIRSIWGKINQKFCTIS